MAATATVRPAPAGSLRRQALQATFFVYVGKFGNSLLAFPLTLLLVRELPVADYGAYTLFGSLLFFTSVFSNLGTLGVLQRFLPEFVERAEAANARSTVRLTAWLRLAGAAASVIVLALFWEPIFGLLQLGADYRPYVPLIALLILVLAEVQIFGDGVLGSLLDQRALTAGRLATNLIRLALTFVALRSGFGLQGVVVVWAAVSVALLGYYLYRTAAILPACRPSDRPDLPSERMLRYGKYYLAGVMGTVVYDTAIDNFVIAHFHGAAEVGRYAFAVFLASLAGSLFPVRLITPILVSVGIRRHASSGSTVPLARMFGLFNKLVAFAILPAAVGVYLLSNEVIAHVFDSRYAEVTTTAAVVLGFSLFRHLNTGLQILIKPLELMHLSLIRYVCSGLNLLLDLWLVPRMGILGAAIATGTTVALNYAVVLVLVARRVELRQDWAGLGRILLNAAPMAAGVWLCRPWIEGPLSLAAVVAVGAALFLGLSTLNRAFTIEERTLINSAAGRRVCPF